MSNDFAALLGRHVNRGWEHLAEIDRPGTATKVDAVRCGTTSTSVLPAPIAARLVAELDDPVSATTGDNRIEVREALRAATAALPARHQVEPTPAALRVFAGTTADICERLATRRGPLNEGHIAAWMTLTETERDTTALAVIANTTPNGAAAVFVDLAVRHGAQLEVPLRGLGDHISTHARNRAERDRRTDAARQGARIALAGWLRDHRGTEEWTTNPTHTTGTPETMNPTPVPAAAGVGLATLAGALGIYFRGPTDLAEAAIEHKGTPGSHTNRLMCAADSGVRWDHVRTHLFGDEFDEVAMISAALRLAKTPAGKKLGVEMFRTELPGMGLVAATSHSVTTAVAAYRDELTVTETLRLIAVTSSVAVDNTTNAYWTHAALAYLTADHAPTRGEVRDAAAADPLIDSYLDRVAAALPRSPRVPTCGTEALAELWDRYVAHQRVSAVWDFARRNTAVADAWGAQLETLIEARAELGDTTSAALWAAVAALADGFSGTTTELVDVAAAAC